MSDRRRTAAIAGHTGDVAAAEAAFGDDDPRVRATALTAIARLGRLTAEVLASGLGDASADVRVRAAAVAAAHPAIDADLLPLLADADPLVAEAAAFALGERSPAPAGVVDALSAAATGHDDALVREAAVAALGAIGDRAGLAAILQATADKPAVRRRAVIALAPFDGPEVDAALQRALTDRDWQVRQAAEDLTAD